MNKKGILYQVLHTINLLRLKLYHFFTEKQLQSWFEKTEYPEKIREFKGIHNGERCFIIGNGPSLRPEDLDLIKDEYTFSCNKIYKILDKTKWRPFYYIVDDYGFVSTDYENIINKVDARAKFVGVEYEKKLTKPFIGTSVILMKERTILHENRPEWHLDVEQYICAGHTVTFPMVELAIYMGFQEIYLIGNDCSYLATFENGGKGQNHFYQGEDDRTSQQDAANLFYAFESIRECARENNVHIYNATRGGALEIFERVDLEKVVRS